MGIPCHIFSCNSLDVWPYSTVALLPDLVQR